MGTAEAAEDVAPAPARYHLLKNYKEVIKSLKTCRFQSPEEKSRNATHLAVLPMLRGGHSRAREQEQPAPRFSSPLLFSAIPAPPRLTSTCSRSAGILPASAARSGGCRAGNPVFSFSSPHQTCAVNDVKASWEGDDVVWCPGLETKDFCPRWAQGLREGMEPFPPAAPAPLHGHFARGKL